MHPLTKALRSDLNGLTNIAHNDLRILFRQFNTAEAARDGLMDVLPRLVTIYGSAAATLAADYFDDLRDASEVKGRFRAIPAEPVTGGLDVLARWAVGPMFQEVPDPASSLSLAAGGAQRSIADAARLTVVQSSLEDPRAQGWVRVGSGECDWCQKYLDGEVHYTEGYDFQAHNNCGCTAEPAY
jgi:hypothetical protein